MSSDPCAASVLEGALCLHIPGATETGVPGVLRVPVIPPTFFGIILITCEGEKS